jgi:FkbM family methyltransferase
MTESSTASLFRHTFRFYRNLPVCPGHALLRRVFRRLIARNQIIQLRNGIWLAVDLDSVVQHTIFWLDGDMEPQLEWAVREFLPTGGTCVDCGANCGYIGLFAHRMRSARVVFIEPHPGLAATIRRNVELNCWQDRCILIEAAASDSTGSTQLFESPDYDGEHSLLQDWTGGRKQLREIAVKRTTLLSVLEDESCERVDFLKVDTEGHDLAVLRGLGDRLRPEFIRVLYTELGRQREEAIRLLQDAGYEGFGFQRGKSGKELRHLLKRYREDRPIMLYDRLTEANAAFGETLWLPKGGPEVAHMDFLANLATR